MKQQLLHWPSPNWPTPSRQIAQSERRLTVVQEVAGSSLLWTKFRFLKLKEKEKSQKWRRVSTRINISGSCWTEFDFCEPKHTDKRTRRCDRSVKASVVLRGCFCNSYSSMLRSHGSNPACEHEWRTSLWSRALVCTAGQYRTKRAKKTQISTSSVM